MYVGQQASQQMRLIICIQIKYTSMYISFNKKSILVSQKIIIFCKLKVAEKMDHLENVKITCGWAWLSCR